MQLRGEILRQLRELKDLKDADVLDCTQFENQKRILLTELNGLQKTGIILRFITLFCYTVKSIILTTIANNREITRKNSAFINVNHSQPGLNLATSGRVNMYSGLSSPLGH